jgi:hypothetical protein
VCPTDGPSYHQTLHLSLYRRFSEFYNWSGCGCEEENPYSPWELKLSHPVGRAIAHTVNRWLPTVMTRGWAWVRSCGICSDQSGTGAGFLRVVWFPLSTIPLTTPHSSSSIIWGGTIDQIVANVQRRLSLKSRSLYCLKYNLKLRWTCSCA